MTLLIVFILVAVVFSFLCSIAEAVLLSVDTPYLASLERKGKSRAAILRKLKENINSPLAVILTLNTIAHTIGAAGAGAQAAIVFGNAYVAIISAILTLIILVFSEIIPKALGANYWRQLAPPTAVVLNILIKVMYPFVILSNELTSWFSPKEPIQGFDRDEFTALADLGEQEGELDPQEAKVLKNLFLLRDTKVKASMTPHSVVFSISAGATCDELAIQIQDKYFSRIPLVEELDKYVGFVLYSDVLLARTTGNGNKSLRSLSRNLPVTLDKFSLLKVLGEFVADQDHIKLVVNEYGDAMGILTLEDIIESLLGQEIVDETDAVTDMQELARRLYLYKIKQ